jgi:hypothetical protein
MKKVALFLLAACLTIGISAQMPDFAGKWKINTSKSKLNQEFSMAPAEITIVQNANEISIERHTDFQGQQMVTTEKYTLDGKECINPGFMEMQKKSTATWDEATKSLKIVSKIEMDGNEIKQLEVLKLDGGNLLYDSSSSSSFGDMSENIVYDKV